MRLRLSAVLLLLASTLAPAAAQQAPPNPAPLVPCKDRTVDEYLAEMHKKQRNKNPLPSDICIFAYCPHPKGQTTDPVSHPPQAPPVPSGTPEQTSKTPAGESSSQPGNAAAGADLRGTSLYDPIAGAKNAEAGDYYFGRQNYRAALSRFEEALQDKPDDPAIHLRLARAYEKLDDTSAAYEHFDAALILSPDGAGAKQAREALERLRPQLAKAGADADAIHARNAAAIAASCPREGSKP
jgi:tetratricopeptide (TPR) repeat protein